MALNTIKTKPLYEIGFDRPKTPSEPPMHKVAQLRTTRHNFHPPRKPDRRVATSPCLRVPFRSEQQFATSRMKTRNPKKFRWPRGRRGAVSISFDDARPSAVEVGVPIDRK